MAIKPIVTSTSASFTRPSNTTAYADGDLIANSTTAASVSPLAFLISVAYGRGLKITNVKIEKSQASSTASDFILNLYTSEPTCTNGDNGAFLTTESGYVGRIDTGNSTKSQTGGLCFVFSDGASSITTCEGDNSVAFRLGSGSYVYGLLEADGAYTPASAETFEVTLTIEHY
jgi:hypothetical protein